MNFIRRELDSQFKIAAKPEIKDVKAQKLVKDEDVSQNGMYNIDEILDSIENGDISILQELGITYTEIIDGSENKSILFKYNNVRYTVHVISNNCGSTKNDNKDTTSTISKTINELKTQREELQNQLYDIQSQLRAMPTPLPPRINDFKTSNGTTEQNAYNKAMSEYRQEVKEYENKINELNKQVIEISVRLDSLDNEIAELELEERINAQQKEIDELRKSPNSNPDLINALQKQLDAIKENGVEEPAEKRALIAQRYDIISRIAGLILPVPPNPSDYMTYSGTIDEEAYNNAMIQYENEIQEFEQTKQILERNLDIVNNELHKIELKENNHNVYLNQLDENINSVKNIQQLLDSIPNTENNKDKITRLQTSLANLAQNINQQNEIRNELTAIYNEVVNTELPTPPNTSDYTKTVYSFSFGPNVYTIEQWEQNSDGTYTIRLNNGSSATCRAIFDENGMITDIRILQESGENITVQVTANTTIDEERYAKAFEEYQKQQKEYDKKMEDLNNQSKQLERELSTLIKEAKAIELSTKNNRKMLKYQINDKLQQVEFLKNNIQIQQLLTPRVPKS